MLTRLESCDHSYIYLYNYCNNKIKYSYLKTIFIDTKSNFMHKYSYNNDYIININICIIHNNEKTDPFQ